MIVVTGGTGFVGSNLVHELNQRGQEEIVVVDDLTDGSKVKNLQGTRIVDYVDQDNLHEELSEGALKGRVDAIYHQGACTDTTVRDGRYMMKVNFEYSKNLLRLALQEQIPFVYASSAAVYGKTGAFAEHPSNEAPLNVYGFSKLVFDEYVRRLLPQANSTVVGLRYFNVYGPREQHKEKMSSIVYQLYRQVQKSGCAKLFEGSGGYDAGEQRRDWVFVDDVVNANLFFGSKLSCTGIFNVGTGESRSFNAVAANVIACMGNGSVEYVAFPDSLYGRYQHFTEADLSALRSAGYEYDFASIEEGVREYVTFLERDHQRSIGQL